MNFPRNLPVGPENVTAEARRPQRDAQEVGNPAIGPHKEGRWCPDFCPLTLRPFFMWLDHPELGYVPTYGGPFDSYTIPEADYFPGEICRPEDIEWVCYRYDHDRGGWHDGGEDPGIRVLHESRIVQRDEVIADLNRSNATLKAEVGKLRSPERHGSAWQPIETAPKDGSSFLATGFDDGDMRSPRHSAVAWWLEDRGHFVEGAEDCPSTAGTLLYLTHWMPLPQPPEAAPADGKELGVEHG